MESNHHGPPATGSAGADLQTGPGRAGFGLVAGRLPVHAIGSIPVSERLCRKGEIHQEDAEGRLFAQGVEVVVAESVR